MIFAPQQPLKIASLFSGAGGMDKGFEQAGFCTVWANEYDASIWATFRHNFPNTHLDTRSITEVLPADIPDVDGFIGGPPCQSWSEAGAKRGIQDHRGQLFLDYIRLLKAKQPSFFVAENVSGILSKRHSVAFANILLQFEDAGYEVTHQLVNANDYGVAQDRQRVLIVGYHQRLKRAFVFPKKMNHKPCLKDVIFDLQNQVQSVAHNQITPKEALLMANHEYMTGGFSSIYMSRNRVRSWSEPSFTIQAGARHAPLHPQAPKMVTLAPNQRGFIEEFESLYRRLSVRECARIQSFPDDFLFIYRKISDGYKMVGNAVPVHLAFCLAQTIAQDLQTSQADQTIFRVFTPHKQTDLFVETTV